MTESRPSATSTAIESVLTENRLFAPRAEFAASAHVRSLDEYRRLFARSLADPEGFWGDAARELHWFTPWSRVLDWNPPDARWFVGARTNLAYNCLDR
ncbi:MAG TPA: acetyl-coenzyme A synthetase, partial [Phycisphaerales bacterium]|nr:acetyl-coenzyme A synthetase [Phycisphaerales bacterium]